MNTAIRPHFLGLLLLALVVFGIERLIVTDEEAIQQSAEALSEAIETEDYEALEALLHPEFRFQGRDRSETIAYIRAQVRKYKPIAPQVVLVDIQVEGDTGRVTGAVQATVYGRPQQLRIEGTFVRTEDDEWLLREVSGGTLPR